MATHGLKSPFSHVRLTRSLKENLRIWNEFLLNFIGRSCWQEVDVQSLGLINELWALLPFLMENVEQSNGLRVGGVKAGLFMYLG